MKYLIVISSLFISSCSCCQNDAVQYQPIDSTVVVTDRYVPIPEILVDGVTTPLTQDDNLGWITFSDVFTDSATGKTIEISGVIPKEKDKIHLSARVPKDSVKVTDTSKTVTLKPIEKEKGWMEKFFENVYYVASFTVAIIFLLIMYSVVRKK